MKELNQIKYLERKPRVEMDKNPLMLLIHGYGSNEADLFSFADDLPDEFHVISVQAFHTLGQGMFAWYEIDFINAEKFNNIPQGLESRDKLVEFIDAITAQENLDKKNVWLCGFSQGAILSYSIALNFPNKVKNIAILSGYPEPELIGRIPIHPEYADLNFYISHGIDDMVIPIEWARNGKPFLEKLGIKNGYHEYNGGHGIVPQNYSDLMAWMKKA